MVPQMIHRWVWECVRGRVGLALGLSLLLAIGALLMPEMARAGTTTRVSVASDGTQGNSRSFYPAATNDRVISADGRYVAFISFATNLVPGDTNSTNDIFVHDLETGQTTRISIASDGTQANSESKSPSISADGRYVAFDSAASNLVPGDTNGARDVFVHDRETGKTTRVSVASNGRQGDSHSEDPSISADGRYVAFGSFSHDLIWIDLDGDGRCEEAEGCDINGSADIYVHDRQTGQTTRVSVAFDGTPTNSGSDEPSISDDGRYVAFLSAATNLVPGDTNGRWDVFVHDRLTGQTTRVSVASDGTQTNSWSDFPSISADGRYVAFDSIASNLVPGDTNGFGDVFVHDQVTGQTTRFSIASDGREANGGSSWPSISADGRYVAFASSANNLVPGDTNDHPDIFVHDRGPIPNLTAGCTPCAEKTGEPIQTGAGEYFTDPHVDINLGGPMPLSFSRIYAARLQSEGVWQNSLGPNWMHNFDLRLRSSPRSLDVVYYRGKIISFKKGDMTLNNPEEVLYELRQDADTGDFWMMDPARRLVHHLSVDGRLLEIKDRNENTLTLAYDGFGKLTQVSDGLGRTLSFIYDVSGNLSGLTDGTRILAFSYTDGVLTGFTDAMGNTTAYEYDITKPLLGPLLTAIVLPLGNRHHIQTYDTQGRVIQQVDAFANATTFEYDTPAPGTTTITDPLGNRRTTGHERQKVMTEATDAQGQTSSFAYDDHDRPTSSTDRLGNTTAMSYQPESGLPT
ncbi:MAG: PD40 domain-containing protein, partial [candidate division NC10 bacterium]|nr:PD40 domain-containing protein [candidate division NC10 bacterium]